MFRVYRDPAEPGYTTGLGNLPDDVQESARIKGWLGPWQLTTSGRLVTDVALDPNIPLEGTQEGRDQGH